MPEHEMHAAEVHELAMERQLESKGAVLDPEKVNLDLGFNAPVANKHVADLPAPHDTDGSYSDTPDDEEPNAVEKVKLRRGRQSMKHNVVCG